MKKLITFILTAFILLSSAAYAVDDIAVYIDGERIEFDVEPQIMNDRAMVPLRKIFEKLGATVEWVPDPQMIFATRGAKCVLMQIGKSAIAVKDFATDEETRTELDTAPVIVDDRTLVPLRAVSEAYGMDVEWDGETSSVYITTEKTE